jgi:IclR family pca regulon transcriptional regulator
MCRALNCLSGIRVSRKRRSLWVHWEVAELEAGDRLSPERNLGYVQSLERGLAVMRTFDAEHPNLTLSEVARATSLTRAAARRFLLTLVELGYVRTDGRFFSLRPAVLELGYAYLSSLGLVDIVQPHLVQLSRTVHESASVSVLDGDDVYYVARSAVNKIMTVNIHIGTRFPAYATSMGRVLLAALPADELDQYLSRVSLVEFTTKTVVDEAKLRRTLSRVASQGYALVDEELEFALRSLAVPIHDREGRVIAAMNVSTHARRGTVSDTVRELLPALTETAAEIEHDLTGKGRSVLRD